MPRRKTGQYDHKAYQNEYHKAMKTKLLSFNPANEDDMQIWEHLQKQKNASKYLKDLIRDDMEENDWLNVIVKNDNGRKQFFCPSCNCEIVSDGDPIYCPGCGQHLNWIDKYI